MVSRRQPTQLTVPFYKIHLNLIPRIIAYNSDQHAAHFLDNVTRLNEVEMMAKKSSLPQITINYYNIIKRRYGFKVTIIYINGETALRNNFKEAIAKQKIILKISPPYTQS